MYLLLDRLPWLDWLNSNLCDCPQRVVIDVVLDRVLSSVVSLRDLYWGRCCFLWIWPILYVSET